MFRSGIELVLHSATVETEKFLIEEPNKNFVRHSKPNLITNK